MCTMPVVRDVLMMLVMVGKRMSKLSYKCGGDGIEFTRFRRCTLHYFQDKVISDGSKVCKGSPVKKASEETVRFGGGKLFLMVRIFSIKY